MAISNPLVVTLGGSGGTAYDCDRIRFDNYGTEYRYSDPGTEEITVKIRHSKETPAAGELPLERHNVEFTHRLFGADGDPDTVRQVYLVIRNNKADPILGIENLGAALSFYMNLARYGDVVKWLS